MAIYWIEAIFIALKCINSAFDTKSVLGKIKKEAFVLFDICSVYETYLSTFWLQINTNTFIQPLFPCVHALCQGKSKYCYCCTADAEYYWKQSATNTNPHPTLKDFLSFTHSQHHSNSHTHYSDFLLILHGRNTFFTHPHFIFISPILNPLEDWDQVFGFSSAVCKGIW